MNEKDYQAIEERWARDKRKFGAKNQDFEALLAEVRRLNNELKEAQATIDTHNELIERMKCCGNCRFDDSYCPATAEIINDKCNAWEVNPCQNL